MQIQPRKGDQIPYTTLFRSRDGLHIKTMSELEYGSANLDNGKAGLRAAQVTNPEDSLVRTVTFRSDDTYLKGTKTTETHMEKKHANHDHISHRTLNITHDGL